VVSGCSDPVDNETITCTSCETIVISATTMSIDGDTYPYTVSGNTLSIDVDGDIYKITYIISGNNLTLNFQDSVADGNCKYVTTYKRI
jgi:hypothetical protein